MRDRDNLRDHRFRHAERVDLALGSAWNLGGRPNMPDTGSLANIVLCPPGWQLRKLALLRLDGMREG